MTFISPQKDLCWICYIGLPKRYKQQPPFGVTVMGRGGGGGERGKRITCNELHSHPVGLAVFCHLIPQNWDKLQLDGLHGSGVDLFKFCLSGKFYFPCVAIFNNLIIINFHVCCFIPLLLLNGNLFYICVTLQSYKKTFPAIPQKQIHWKTVWFILFTGELNNLFCSRNVMTGH